MSNVAHHSVAIPEVQVKRKNKKIPGAGHLHDYANLYFDAHNPMLSACRSQNDVICVIRVEPKALDLPGVIITDRNAASGYVRFPSVKDGLKKIDKERVFAQYWKHPDDIFDDMSHKSEKFAEVLVTNRVEPYNIIGAYTGNKIALAYFQKLRINLAVCVKNNIFF